MKIETQPLEDRQVKIVAEFDSDTFEEYKRRAARKISQNVRIPGFRPGKAPIDLIRRIYGEEAIQQEAIELLVDEQYPKVLEEADVDPSGPGSLEEIVSTDPPKFTFLIPLKPEVQLGNYQELRVPYEPKPVTDEEVEEFLQRMRRNYATAEPVERPVEDGDLVYVDLAGDLVDPQEGEDPAVFPERPAQFLIGETDEEERTWPFPGFEEHLKGLSENEEKTIRYTFAEDNPDEALRGKEVEFKVKVNSIKRLILPELDDEFAKTLGNFDTLDDVRKAIREQMEANNNAEYERDYFNRVIDEIINQATIAFPPQMVEEEEKHVIDHLKQDLGRQGMDFDAYLKLLGKERDEYVEEVIRPAAIKRVQRSLVLDELAKAEKIELSQEDVDQAISGTMAQLDQIPRKGKKSRLPENFVNAMAYDAISRVYNQRILERVKAIATGQAEAKVETESEASVETVEEAKNEEAQVVEEPAAEETVESTEKTEEPKEE